MFIEVKRDVEKSEKETKRMDEKKEVNEDGMECKLAVKENSIVLLSNCQYRRE